MSVQQHPVRIPRARPGFSLVDVLVSLAVIALLLGIMLPSLSQARDIAKRVACASNIRQVGLGLGIYADDYRDRLPPTVHREKRTLGIFGYAPSETTTLRLAANKKGIDSNSQWDGIGRFYEGDYLPVPQIFYCPSHGGDQKFSDYSNAWHSESGEIRGNYQFRGEGPNGEKRLSRIEPSRSALISDSLRTKAEFNHVSRSSKTNGYGDPLGVNVLFADLSVRWIQDVDGLISHAIPKNIRFDFTFGDDEPAMASQMQIDEAWDAIDRIGGGKHGLP